MFSEGRFEHDMAFITIYAFNVPVEYKPTSHDHFHLEQILVTCENIQGDFMFWVNNLGPKKTWVKETHCGTIHIPKKK